MRRFVKHLFKFRFTKRAAKLSAYGLAVANAGIGYAYNENPVSYIPYYGCRVFDGVSHVLMFLRPYRLPLYLRVSEIAQKYSIESVSLNYHLYQRLIDELMYSRAAKNREALNDSYIDVPLTASNRLKSFLCPYLKKLSFWRRKGTDEILLQEDSSRIPIDSKQRIINNFFPFSDKLDSLVTRVHHLVSYLDPHTANSVDLRQVYSPLSQFLSALSGSESFKHRIQEASLSDTRDLALGFRSLLMVYKMSFMATHRVSFWNELLLDSDDTYPIPQFQPLRSSKNVWEKLATKSILARILIHINEPRSAIATTFYHMLAKSRNSLQNVYRTSINKLGFPMELDATRVNSQIDLVPLKDKLDSLVEMHSTNVDRTHGTLERAEEYTLPEAGDRIFQHDKKMNRMFDRSATQECIFDVWKNLADITTGSSSISEVIRRILWIPRYLYVCQQHVTSYDDKAIFDDCLNLKSSILVMSFLYNTSSTSSRNRCLTANIHRAISTPEHVNPFRDDGISKIETSFFMYFIKRKLILYCLFASVAALVSVAFLGDEAVVAHTLRWFPFSWVEYILQKRRLLQAVLNLTSSSHEDPTYTSDEDNMLSYHESQSLLPVQNISNSNVIKLEDGSEILDTTGVLREMQLSGTFQSIQSFVTMSSSANLNQPSRQMDSRIRDYGGLSSPAMASFEQPLRSAIDSSTLSAAVSTQRTELPPSVSNPRAFAQSMMHSRHTYDTPHGVPNVAMQPF